MTSGKTHLFFHAKGNILQCAQIKLSTKQLNSYRELAETSPEESTRPMPFHINITRVMKTMNKLADNARASKPWDPELLILLLWQM